MSVPLNRKGCPFTAPPPPPPLNTDTLPPIRDKFVYWNTKLTHSGATCFKVFEGFERNMKKSSLTNLLNYTAVKEEEEGQEAKVLKERTLSQAQSRKCRSFCQKLAYYSATRTFRSSKSGSYKFKVAFLTLTAPVETTTEQALKAFDHFLDYLRRTANCVYVWKKELGEQGKHLHFHVLINNFIPYYIVSWKWKRLLIAEGVAWPLTEKNVHTDSHYRIEIPKSKRQISHYISKYLSKAYLLPRNCGYVFGHSAVLANCKEVTLTEGEFPDSELKEARKLHYCIQTEFFLHICCDFRKLKDKCPYLHDLFDEQYLLFCEAISLPQKFHVV